MNTSFKKDYQFYKFCLYGFLKNLRFFEPFFIIWLLSKDLTYLQIGVIYSVRELSRNVLEIPSGFFADGFGKRKSLLMSYSFYIVSFLAYYLSSEYWIIIAASVIYGIADAFRTGTHKALIFNYLKLNNWSGYKVDYYGYTRSWSMIGSGISALLAAVIVIFAKNFNFIFLLSIVPYLVGMYFIYSYPVEIDQVDKRTGSLNVAIKESLKDLFSGLKDFNFIKVLLNTAIVSGIYLLLRDYVQAIINGGVERNINLFSNPEHAQALLIGVIYFIIYMLNARASIYAKTVYKRIQKYIKALNLTYLLFFAGVAIAGFSYYLKLEIPAVIVIILLLNLHNLRKPISTAALSDCSKSTNLATVLSIESQLSSLIMVIMAPLLGYLTDTFGLGWAFLIISFVALIILGLLYLFKSKDIEIERC